MENCLHPYAQVTFTVHTKTATVQCRRFVGWLGTYILYVRRGDRSVALDIIIVIAAAAEAVAYGSVAISQNRIRYLGAGGTTALYVTDITCGAVNSMLSNI